MRVAIDAGHGYNTGGKRSYPFKDGRQLREHEFTRDVAFILAEKLKASNHQPVFCFDDIGIIDMPLEKRCNIANKEKADIYISIHGSEYKEGSSWNDAKGLTALYYSEQGKKTG